MGVETTPQMTMLSLQWQPLEPLSPSLSPPSSFCFVFVCFVFVCFVFGHNPSCVTASRCIGRFRLKEMSADKIRLSELGCFIEIKASGKAIPVFNMFIHGIDKLR